MKENSSTNHRTREIVATLKIEQEQDLLVFSLENERIVHLKSKDCQQEIKNLFSEILRQLTKEQLSIALKIDDGYSNTLIKDVCLEYIKDLNKEINQIYNSLPDELKKD